MLSDFNVAQVYVVLKLLLKREVSMESRSLMISLFCLTLIFCHISGLSKNEKRSGPGGIALPLAPQLDPQAWNVQSLVRLINHT